MLARVFATATCLSARLSVTRRYCVKTKKASIMISSPSGSPKTLVFWCQISSPNSKGFPPSGNLKQGWIGKIQGFFYLRDAMLARVIAIAAYLSVCPSHAAIVSKRRKLASWFLHHLVAPRLWFSDAKFRCQIQRGSLERGPQTGWGVKIQRFSSFKRQYPENGSDTAKVTISD